MPAAARRGPVTLLVFTAGAVLMALEIAGSRVLAPFFGGSVFVWGSLIGIFLGAMSGGYWLGGWLSERWPRPALLNALLAAAGASTALLPLWAGPLCRSLAGGPGAVVDLGPRLGPLTAALVLFALPSVLMGVASPFAVRLLAVDLTRVGAVAGRLAAVGTLGSILGTLATAFWLIPALGVSTILTAIGVLLMAAAVVTLPFGRRSGTILGVGAVVVVLRLLVSPPVLLEQPPRGRYVVVEARDSAYASMMVVDHLLPGPDGREVPVARQLRFDDHVQGAIFVHPWQRRGVKHWSAAPYTDLFHLVHLFVPRIERVLFIGGGVGVGPRSFLRRYPEARIDLVEIDPVVIELARTHFDLAGDDRLAVHVVDGRAFLRRRPEARWDAIIVDAFTPGGRLPFHLMTREFVELMRARLAPGGVVLTNLPSALSGPGSGILRAELATFGEVFGSLYVFPRVDPREEDVGSAEWSGRTRNVFLAATDGETVDRDTLLARAEELWGDLGRAPHTRVDTELFHLADHARNLIELESLRSDDVFAAAKPLTDDYAPVDVLAAGG